MCAELYRQAWRGMWFVPQALHSADEDRRWMREVFARQFVLVAEAEADAEADPAVGRSRVVGFLSVADGTIHNLYVLPGYQGQGVGHALIEVAKESSAGQLRLWVFEPNKGAIRFYKRHGFTTLRRTDGRDNEEKVADRLMVWRQA